MNRAIIWTACLVAMAALLASCSKGQDATGRADRGRNGAPAAASAGDMLPATTDFTLADQDGKQVRLSDYAGKIVVLEWTNPDCPYVQRHYKAGTMLRLAEEYAPKGVAWLAVNSTNYYDQARNKQWRTSQSLPYPVLDDHSGAVGRQFGAKTTPHMFVLDPSGKLAYQGAIDDDIRGDKGQPVNYVAAALDDLLAGRPVATTTSTPYGCTVKYAP